MAIDSDEENDRYRFSCCCCFNFHAERGAYTIAIFGITCSIVSTMVSLVFLNRLSIVGELIHILLCCGILYAQKSQNPNYYLPYLFGMVLTVIMLLALSGLLLILLVMLPDRNRLNEHWSQQYSGAEEQNAFLLLMLAVFVIVIFNIWILRIVYSAYDYMKTKAFRQLPQQSHQAV